MKLGIYLEMLIIGIPVGLLVLGLLAGEERRSTRLQVTRWCIRSGMVAAVMLAAAILLPASWQIDDEPVKMALIGLPAFSTALILALYDKLTSKARNSANPPSPPTVEIAPPGVER